MREVCNRPILTESFDSLEAFTPPPGSAYLYGVSPEERSAHSAAWAGRAQGVIFAPVIDQGRAEIRVRIGADDLSVSLRSSRAIEQLWSSVAADILFTDFTGLAHHVWAPLLRSALASGRDVRAVYVEPKEYTYSRTPTQGEIFDLSERISGIAPLPRFASLGRPPRPSVFVPLLGLEGTHFKYMAEEVQPADRRIIPIIGVPGFQPEYPFHNFMGNRTVLEETKAWRQVRFAKANCPFSALYALLDIAAHWPQDVIKVAPIGTKPHALGAVLFYLSSGRPIEIIYDHPVRSAGRTTGAARASVYHVSALQYARVRLEPLRARDVTRQLP